MVDQRIVDFAELASDNDELDARLEQSMRHANLIRLINVFSFTELAIAAEELILELAKRKTGPALENMELSEKFLKDITAAQKTALSFHRQLEALYAAGDDTQLKEREKKAAAYFNEQVFIPCIAQLDKHLATFGTQTKVARQVKSWKNFKTLMEQKKAELAG